MRAERAWITFAQSASLGALWHGVSGVRLEQGIRGGWEGIERKREGESREERRREGRRRGERESEERE